jgi:hypothetical protein
MSSAATSDFVRYRSARHRAHPDLRYRPLLMASECWSRRLSVGPACTRADRARRRLGTRASRDQRLYPQACGVRGLVRIPQFAPTWTLRIGHLRLLTRLRSTVTRFNYNQISTERPASLRRHQTSRKARVALAYVAQYDVTSLFRWRSARASLTSSRVQPIPINVGNISANIVVDSSDAVKNSTIPDCSSLSTVTANMECENVRAP